MIKFLLYEPDKAKAEHIRTTIKALFLHIKSSYELTTFFTAEDAKKRIVKDPLEYDIIFVNIDEFQDALTLLKIIRTHNIKTSLIFLGDSYHTLCRLMIFRPSSFIPHMLDKNELAGTIYQLYQEQKQQQRCFLIKNRDEIERIPYEQIEFFESSNRKVYLHTRKDSKVYEFNAKIDDVIKAINVCGFIRCHQSCLVNLDNVRKIDKVNRCFTTFSGKTVDISKRSLSEVVSLFEQYLNLINK